MRIAIKGFSGFIGKHLTNFLQDLGHSIIFIPREIPKDLSLENLDALIDLSGENVGSRWSSKKKEVIYTSRVEGTKTLVTLINNLKNPPKIFMRASAIGYYGVFAENAEEKTPPGKDFLALTCTNLEKEANKYLKGTVIILRFGIVIGKNGGILKKMLPIFRIGLGGVVGDGRQVISWIALKDLLEGINFLLNHPASGAFNFVSPNYVSNKQFTKALGKLLQKRAFVPLPAFLVKILFGEMGKATLLSSCQANPKRLLENGFVFQYGTIEKALAAGIEPVDNISH